MRDSPPRCIQEGGGLASLGGRYPRRRFVYATEPPRSQDLARLSRRRASPSVALRLFPSARHRVLLLTFGHSFYTPWVVCDTATGQRRGRGCKQRADMPDFTLCNTGRWRNELMPRCMRSHKTGCRSYAISPVNAYLSGRMLLSDSCMQNLRRDDIPAECGRPMSDR